MRVNTSDFIIKSDSAPVKYYTKKGLEEFLDNDNNPCLSDESEITFAKAIQNKKSKHFNVAKSLGYTYYIKTDPNKNIFNPIHLYSIESNNKKGSFLNKVCKEELVFTEVSESTFGKYLNFLKTENTQWLTNAQRDIK